MSYREQHGPVLLQAGGLNPGALLLCIGSAAVRNLWRKSIFIQVLQAGEAGVSFQQDGTPFSFWAPPAAVADAATPQPVSRQGQRPLQSTRQSSITVRLTALHTAVQLAELLDALVDQCRGGFLVSDGHAAAEQDLKLLGEDRRRHWSAGRRGGGGGGRRGDGGEARLGQVAASTHGFARGEAGVVIPR